MKLLVTGGAGFIGLIMSTDGIKRNLKLVAHN
jgi:nucleoside-diphosphate-sugar epimerase